MSNPRPQVIVIEDDAQIRRFMRAGLGAHGFEVHEAETGRSGLAAVMHSKPALVILDLGLPDMDGVDVVRQLREWTSMPVLVLSARTLESDKIAALDAGADDYVTKPFGMGELLARIRVALRHSDGTGSAQARNPVFEAGTPDWKIKVDLARRNVVVNGQEVHFTPIEYRLLAMLVRHAGRVLTHRQLLKEVWGPAHVEHTHYLRIYMAVLRNKLEQNPARPRVLLTESGVGYRLVEGHTNATASKVDT
ncbi:MAG TPA: response regulator [Burkholderiales bacterium]|nr:response regulator [Burkholderiales bacterium]